MLVSFKLVYYCLASKSNLQPICLGWPFQNISVNGIRFHSHKIILKVEMEITIHWSWMTSAIICSNKNIQKLAYSNIVWTFWHISSHENLWFKNSTCSFFLLKSPRIRRHLHQRPSEFHEAWSCNSHEWKGRMSPLKGYPLPLEHRSWGQTHDPNVSIFICAYLERLWTKTRWEKQKRIIPFCKLTQQMSLLEKAVTPQKNKNRSHPSGMTSLEPQDVKDYIRFHQTLEYIQPLHPP